MINPFLHNLLMETQSKPTLKILKHPLSPKDIEYLSQYQTAWESIKTLVLKKNYLDDLPKAFGQLKNLQNFCCNENLLRTV